MTDIVLPLSQEELFNFISEGVAPSPQEIYALMLTNFSDENQAIINSPGNPFGSFLLTSAVATSAILGQVVELNSNLVFTDSQGEWLRKNLFNFGSPLIPATSTVVRIGFDIDTQVTIAEGTIFLDELNQQFAPNSPFSSTDLTGELNLYSIELGSIAARGTPIPQTPITSISNLSTISTTLGRPEETDDAVKTRLENAKGAKIFGTSLFVESALLNQTDFVLSAKVTSNNTNSDVIFQGITVDNNSIISIVRSLVDPEDSISAIGATIFNSIKSGQKLSQPPETNPPLRGVEFSSGYVDEAALNAAGYETDVDSDWSVWSPDDLSGIVNIPFINAQAQEMTITYNVIFLETISFEQRNSLINQIKIISLEQTPIFSQTFSRIQIAQYFNAVFASIVDNTVEIVDIFLSVVGDVSQQNKQSIISDLNSYLDLPGTIVDGSAITSNVIINEV